MQYSKLALLAVAAPAVAQLGGLKLPADLESYVGSLQGNTAVAAALAPIITASQVQGVVAQILTAGPNANPTALASSLEAAAAAAIDQLPSSNKAVAQSVIGVVTSLAAKDGAVTSIAGQVVTNSTVSARPTNSANSTLASITSAASRSASGAISQSAFSTGNTMAPTASQTPNLAAQPTGMAIGAIVAGFAGIIMAL